MAHFAQLDENNIVLNVIVVNDSDCQDDNGNESEAVGIQFCQSLFGDNTVWKQTSYNANIRKNYAGVGYTFDSGRDAFISPKPFESWVFNETTCRWDAPYPMPVDDNDYYWDEASYQQDNSQGWVVIE